MCGGIVREGVGCFVEVKSLHGTHENFVAGPKNRVNLAEIIFHLRHLLQIFATY